MGAVVVYLQAHVSAVSNGVRPAAKNVAATQLGSASGHHIFVATVKITLQGQHVLRRRSGIDAESGLALVPCVFGRTSVSQGFVAAIEGLAVYAHVDIRGEHPAVPRTAEILQLGATA